MAGRWTDDHQDDWRARDGGGYGGGDGRDVASREDRSFDRNPRSGFAARRGGPDRDRVFGERESGVSYGNAPSTGYQGRLPGRPAASFGAEDYTSGGRFYGDDSRERVYREEYGQGGVAYGVEPRGYDAGGFSPTRAGYHAAGYGDPGFGDYPEPARRRASGGTGGYDYERGYGDAGRRDEGGDRDRSERSGRFEEAGRHAGQFLHRAGEKVAHWLAAGSEAAAYGDFYDQPSHRGRGPQGYKRSDERISDDAHDRLTDDHWLDASEISVAVSAGEVTLSGRVDNREAKHRAERIVEGVPGVAHVQNNLRAGGDRGESVLGAQIRTADDAVANGTGGSGAGQSTAGRKT